MMDEQHYTVVELAKTFRMSKALLYEWFRNEPGVLKWGGERTKGGRKRVSLRVPESVARRVYKRHTGRDVQPAEGNR